MLCPVCEQEGRPVTCIAGSRERQIVYHPAKPVRNICNVAVEGAQGKDERHEQAEA